MARSIRQDNNYPGTYKKERDRTAARELLRDFERQYIASNQDSQIYL